MIFSKQEIMSVLDLTSLNEDDTPESILSLCKKINPNNNINQIAAICVYPKFVDLVKNYLKNNDLENINLATVVNFPSGSESESHVLSETQKALNLGANEIDWVFPYREFQAGARELGATCAREMADFCHQHQAKLKIILETGALNHQEILDISRICIESGADFLKTSTGKMPQGASLEAAQILLQAIQESGKHDSVGIKLSGGVREIQSAQAFMQQAAGVFGRDWVQAQHFRIGASALFNQLIN